MPVCAKAMALQLYLAEGAAVFPRLAVMLVVWMQFFQVAPKNMFCNTASEPPTVPIWPAPGMGLGAAKALGALTVLLALAAWWKQEDWRPVLLAFVLGLTGIAFQGMYMLASAALLVAVVLMALSAAFG